MCHYHSFISTYSHIFSPPLSSFLCTQLLFSHLNSNQLSGTIPDSIGNLVKLSQLYVCGNIIPYLYQHIQLSVDEIGATFGDNDKLSALVASKVNAELLILLTDIDGFYDKNPKTNKLLKSIKLVENITKD